MKYTEEQFQSLPKWAQSLIIKLQNDNFSLEEKCNQLGGQDRTNTFLIDGLSESPLPKNSQIEFRVGENLSNKVNVYIKPNGIIDISSNSRSGMDMVILPRASNCFYISFAKI